MRVEKRDFAGCGRGLRNHRRAEWGGKVDADEGALVRTGANDRNVHSEREGDARVFGHASRALGRARLSRPQLRYLSRPFHTGELVNRL